MKILFFIALLVAVIALQRPCSEAAGNFVGQFDDPKAAKDAGPAKVDPALPPGNYVEIDTSMSDEEIKKALERAGAGPDGEADSGAPKASSPIKASSGPATPK